MGELGGETSAWLGLVAGLLGPLAIVVAPAPLALAGRG
jgi:hypothetical protein